jgi:hypothetical protein
VTIVEKHIKPHIATSLEEKGTFAILIATLITGIISCQKKIITDMDVA